MKRAFLAVLLVALAGCSDAPPEPEPPADSTPVVTAVEPDPVRLTVDVPAPVEDQQLTLTGTVDRTVELEIGIGDATRASMTVGPGEWAIDVELDFYGEQPVDVIVNDDGTYVFQSVPVNALAPAQVTLDFGATSSTPSTDDTVWVDMTRFASEPDYDAQGGRHPDMVTVHDVMVTWEAATGHDVEYSYSERYSAFSVERIDGEGNGLDAGEPPWWCFDLNGERADFGISLQPFTPGDRIDWDLGTC